MNKNLKNWMWLLVAVVWMIPACKTNAPEPETETLSEEEVAMIKYMREEEKLARDVYTYLYNEWGSNIFANIAQSEQNHMNLVKALLDKYQIEDPASDQPGVFNNDHLQQLYNDLIALGSNSQMDALIVGATIEDLDIYDLEEYLKQTDNDDIKATFNLLDCGSRNHLRSFYNQITANGGDYTPQFIDQAEFDAIVNSQHEQCGG